MGLASFGVKERIMWRMESVDSSVVMPRREASNPANVLLPQPLVPATSMATLRLRSWMLHMHASGNND